MIWRTIKDKSVQHIAEFKQIVQNEPRRAGKSKVQKLKAKVQKKIILIVLVANISFFFVPEAFKVHAAPRGSSGPP